MDAEQLSIRYGHVATVKLCNVHFNVYTFYICTYTHVYTCVRIHIYKNMYVYHKPFCHSWSSHLAV